jgi:transposase-like protein
MESTIRYSEAFKRRVISEIEQGKHRSIEAARRTYGIGGAMTVSRWARKYGREELIPTVLRVQTLKERDELKEARKRIRELEAAVADAHIDYCLEKGYLQTACERLGVDMDDFKKKSGITLSETRKPAKGKRS